MEFNLYSSGKILAYKVSEKFEVLDNDFLILNKSDKEFFQVLTLAKGYTVEIREIINTNLIRQYRIGKNPVKNV